MNQTPQINSIGDLILFCPRCRHKGLKIRIVRKSVNDFACCPRCSFSVHPAKCGCDKCGDRRANRSTPVVRIEREERKEAIAP